MKILFISRWYPYPPDNGSKLRVYNLLRGLAKEHEVTLLSFADGPVSGLQNGEIRSICAQVSTVPWKAYNPESTQARLGFLSMVPRSVKDTYSAEMAVQIQRFLSAEKYDCVIASQADTAGYWKYFRELPAIFEEVELGVLYEKYANAGGAREKVRHGLTWVKHRQYLASLIRNFMACTVVSEKEKRLVSRILPDYRSIQVIPNCIHLADYDLASHQPEPGTIIFTGSFRYFPNYNAMTWFINGVFPQIIAQVPRTKLVITGDHANLPLPSNDHITLTGFVDDVRPLVANSSVSIAPLLQGGGTRLKILEAMALRTPVVATSKGAEGLDVTNGEEIIIADNETEFASAVVRLLYDNQLRSRLVENGYRLIKAKYDWSVVMPDYLDLIQKVVTQKVVH